MKLLRALTKSNDYIMNNPEEARAITARQTGEETVSLADYDFGLKLGQSMLINLENQARWAIKNRLTDRKEVPNFLSLMYIKGLEAVDSRAVTVIHQ
jgi:NitT/TauT family transport system substrate-binding protein